MTTVRSVAAATIIALLFASRVAGMSVVPRDFDQLVARADKVFAGTVTEQSCVWKGEGKTRRIMTLVTFRVHETYKGEESGTEVLELLGGVIGDDRLEVFDMPAFVVGRPYVLFVVGNGLQICPLVGIQQGLFNIERDSTGAEERVYTYSGKPLRDTGDLGKVDDDGELIQGPTGSDGQAMSAKAFRDRIMQKVAEYAADPAAAPPDNS